MAYSNVRMCWFRTCCVGSSLVMLQALALAML